MRGLTLVLFGLVLCGAGLAAAGATGTLPVRLPDPSMSIAAAASLAGGICGLIAIAAGSVSRRRLARRLDRLRDEGRLRRLPIAAGACRRTLEAVNGVIALAERSVADAQLRANELELQVKVITAERQHMGAIIDSISDAVLVTNAFDDLVLANDSAARLFGFDLGRALRAPVAKLLDDPALIDLIRDMRQSDSRNGRRIVEHSVPSAAGERVYKVTLSCIAAQAEAPEGVVAVLHDMTREREVARMKSEFVSGVSHELRTPLASIKAYAEMLIDGEAADEKTAREFYEVIHNEANRLGRLIDNILNISRIESGLMKVNRQPQSLTMILKEAIEVITPQARQKGQAIVERIAPAFYQVLIDRDMLYESVLNLLSNAVKYTPEGGTITVDNIVDEARRKVAVRIADNGAGIPPKDLPFIFDKFYRSEANSKLAKGTGLGLSLVKRIIETVHHGRMFVESQVGKGSTFGFDLDLVE